MKQLILCIITVLAIFACKTEQPEQSTYFNKVNEIDSLLSNTNLGNRFNGSILIAEGENVLFENAYGVSLPGNPNEVNTQYDLASMTKMFTATAIMQLVEQNKLTVEQTIGDLLPDYPNEEAKAIKIKHLLSHTSGMGDYLSPSFFENESNIKTLQDYLPYFVNDPMNFEAGQKMRYSNAGFIVLGLIIEKITNQDYADYITQNIIKPAGMSNTGSFSSSAGGGHSTVNDLHKFALALKNNKLINKESLQLMTTDHFGHGYGYGMSIRKLNNFGLYGHSGGAPNASGELDMVMSEPLIIVSLSNRDPMSGWAQMRTNMRKTFFGSTPQTIKFLNTEKLVETYNEQGFAEASALLPSLENNISERNTYFYAEKYATQNQPEKAIELMKLAIQAHPTELQPHIFLADFQIQAGLKEDALKSYNKALEISPENIEVLEQLKKLEQ